MTVNPAVNAACNFIKFGFFTFNQVATPIRLAVAIKLVEDEFWELDDVPDEYKQKVFEVINPSEDDAPKTNE